MTNQPTFYTASEKAHPAGLAIAYLAVLIITFFTGYFYTSFVTMMPFIYINFFITIGFGFGVGFLVRMLVRPTHNRSKKSQMILALVAGLLANTFQWLTFILYALSGDMPSLSAYFESLSLLFIPLKTLSVIGEINKAGLWSIFGIPFNGFLLATVWLIEFALITILPILTLRSAKAYPYSEALGKWYGKFTLNNDFEAISAVSQFTEDLMTDAVAAIEKLAPGSGWRHSKIHIYHLEGEQFQFIDIEKINIEGRGKGKKTSTLQINNLQLENRVAKVVMDKFKNTKERFDIF